MNKKKLVVLASEGMDWIIVPDTYSTRVKDALSTGINPDDMAKMLDENDIPFIRVKSDGEQLQYMIYPEPNNA